MVGLDRLPEHVVDPGRGHPLVALTIEPLGRVDRRLHVPALGRRDEGDGRPGHRAKCVAEVLVPLPLLHVGRVEVPLVDHEDHWLGLLGDRLGELLVDLADWLRGVEEEEHHVGPADAPLGPVRGVEVDVGGAALGPS